MCRSIKQLRFADGEPTDQELYDAARQFVRKVSGYRTPSKKNQDAFELAIQEIAQTTRKMLQEFTPPEPHSHPHPHAHPHDTHAHSTPN